MRSKTEFLSMKGRWVVYHALSVTLLRPPPFLVSDKLVQLIAMIAMALLFALHFPRS